MADTANLVLQTLYNGYKNAIITASLTSDGSGLAAYKIYDATATGSFGVSQAGQTFYPGLNSTLRMLDYDVQDMKIQLLWDATTPQQFLALGSAPQDFDWNYFGGYKVPAGLVGATGSILLTTVNQAPNSTMFVRLHIKKGVPQS